MSGLRSDAASGRRQDVASARSGRRRARARSWFSYQANVTGRGIVASYSLRFWAIVLVLGVVTGAGASALVGLLHLVEHLAFGYRSGPFLDGVAAAASWRRVAALVVAAGVVAMGVYLLGRLPVSGGTEVSEAVWLRGAHMAVVQSVARAVLSIVTVGLGVSLGREGAPQLVGAATGSWLSDWGGLPTWQRRLLVASGAGAGFAAVYNVPLGGTLFALEVLLGTLALPLVLPALATSVIATCVAWIALGTGPTYRLPLYAIHPQQLAWAALVGPIIGAVAIWWVRIIAWAGSHRPTGPGRYIAPLAIFLILGLVSIQYPQLLGNGKGVVQLAAVGSVSFGLLWVLLALKPLATAACLWTGSPGGLFTPTLTVGALLAGNPGLRLAAPVPRRPARQLRDHRRRRLSGGIDAGTAVRGGPGPRAHPQLRLPDGAHASRGGGGDRDRAPSRRAVDLLGATAPRPRRADGALTRCRRRQHPGAGRLAAGGRRCRTRSPGRSAA